MITFSRLGRHGNLGNQLHQIASLIGFREKYGCDLVLPNWKYAKFFTNNLCHHEVIPDYLLEEQVYHFSPSYWDFYADKFRKNKVDIVGWLQSEKYWIHAVEEVMAAFKFNQGIFKNIQQRFGDLFEKQTIAISIRRGDFATNPNFYLLPLDYYFSALLTHFPNYSNYNILIFSDDLQYCKIHIRAKPFIYFAIELSDIEQLYLMSQCKHFIISNSTFSWWGARLGEKEGSKVIRSPYQLSGDLYLRFDTKDYYPDRWLCYDHLKDNINAGIFLSSTSRILYFKILSFLYRRVKRLSNVYRNKLIFWRRDLND